MSGKIYLELDFPFTNDVVTAFNNKCCSWGQKKAPYDAEGKIRGKKK